MDFKKCLIYSTTIYIIIIMILILQQPNIIQNRSWSYFKKMRFTKFEDIFCFPLLTLIIALISFILAYKLSK